MGERALLPVQTNSTPDADGALQVNWRCGRYRLLVQRRMQGGAGMGQRVCAALEVQVVVAVAAVEAAATGGDQPTVTQQPQVVGDQVLRLTDPRHQFTDPVVAVGELGQQPPPQRVGGQAQERRGRLARRGHDRQNTSNRFDRISLG